jgi:protein phosphatase 1L
MEDTHVIVASLSSSSSSSSSGFDQKRGGDGVGREGGIEDDAVPVSFYGVFDGHCGAVAAELAAAHLHLMVGARKNAFLGGLEGRSRRKLTEEECVARARGALEEAFAEMEGLIMKTLREDGRRQDGSAAVTAVVAGERLFVANLGDCRAVLATQTPEGRVEATRLSCDHKPDLEEEKKRILKAGGSVEFSGCWRVAHSLIPMRLAVSRSFGDPTFKRPFARDAPLLMLRRHVSGRGVQEDEIEAVGKGGLPPPLPPVGFEPLVSPVPEVTYRVLTRDDLFLVLASDGVWDVMSDLEAVLVVAEVFQRHNTLGNAKAPFTGVAVKEAADRVIAVALSKGAYDNCTAVVVGFQVQ